MTTRALNILIVHGIGWGESGKSYAKPLQRNIGEAFEDAVRRLRLPDVPASAFAAKNALRFDAAYWSPVTQRPQDALIKMMGKRGWPLLRKLNPFTIARRQMVGLLGDVIAYESGGKNPVYVAIHGVLRESVQTLARAAKLEDGDHAPLTVIGHSLGSVIASDFVWDSTRGADENHHFRDFPFAVKNMVLLGSPMAIYALRGNPNAGPAEIADALDAPVQVDPNGGAWLNMYDQQDPIGFPLKPIRAYADAGVIDIPVRAGSWLASLTPMSHVGYWKCQEVAGIVARKLALDWAALNVPDFAAERYAEEVDAYQKETRRGR